MALHIPRRRLARDAFQGRTRGFTLIELLVALAVLSVGTGILVSMFNRSVELAGTSSHRIVASQLAEAKLHEIIAHPENFVREAAESPTDLYRILTEAGDDPIAGMPFEAPGVRPYTVRAQAINDKAYEEMRWRAYGRSPRDAAGAPIAEPDYIDLVVEVLWEEKGRDQALAFTSILEMDRIPPEHLVNAAVSEAEESAEVGEGSAAEETDAEEAN